MKAILLALLAPALAVAQRPLTFGIAKSNGAGAAKKAKSLIEPYLTKALGERVKVNVFEDNDSLSNALASGGVDLAWTTPVAFAKASEVNEEVRAIAKAQRGAKPSTGRSCS
jgi:ABC-type phosphate/phosphonate transport system substrate-binding protein